MRLRTQEFPARVWVLTTWLTAAACQMAAPAHAQSTPPTPRGQAAGPGRVDPWMGVFAPPETDPPRPKSLTVSASLYGGYDRNTAFGVDSPSPVPFFQSPGGLGGAKLTAAFMKRWRYRTLAIDGVSQHARYPNITDRTMNGYSGRVRFGSELGSRTSLNTSLMATYMPMYALPFGATTQVFPTQYPSNLAGPVQSSIDLDSSGFGDLPFDSAILLQESINYDTRVGIAHRFDSKTSLSVNGAAYLRDFRENNGRSQPWADTSFWNVGATLHRSIARGLGARIGYGYTQARFAVPANLPLLRNHNINAGLDYNATLPLTQRTSLVFGTGSGLVNRQLVEGSPAAVAQTEAYISARAALTHHLGRTWLGRLSYRRDLAYLDGFVEPTLATWINAAVSGAVSRRADAGLVGFFSDGRLGFFPLNGYRLWGGTGRLRYALSRRASAFAQYTMQGHDFRENVSLPAGFPNRFDRHSVRVGVTLWAPVF